MTLDDLEDEKYEYLTLTRFYPVHHYAHNVPDADQLRGVFIDCETTGLDPEVDKIIQLAIVPFTFTREGDICEVARAFVEYEDPGVPLSPEVQRITGLTDAQLAGKKIADSAVSAVIGTAKIVICHNAEFDRQMLEKRFPLFEELFFGCSMRDIPWEQIGETCLKLEWLAFKRLGVFYDAHAADIDCYVGIALLHEHFGDPYGTGLDFVLAAARRSYVRVLAYGSPYETRHTLKARDYRWNAEEKVWYKDIPAAEGTSERDWLLANVGGNPLGITFDARQRFSNRIGR